MTAFSMILSFVFLTLGGYGFSSTKVASLNIPLMEKIAPTVHSWVFLEPLLCGLILFAYAVMSVSEAYKHKALQGATALFVLIVLKEIPATINSVVLLSGGMRPSLEDLLQFETTVFALIFVMRAFVHMRRMREAIAQA